MSPPSMQLQIISDLHLEYSKSETNAQKQYDSNITPAAPILALLGDIGFVEDYKDACPDEPYRSAHLEDGEQGFFGFIERQLIKFEYVLYIMGNHEPYGTSWPKAKASMKMFEERMRLSHGIEQEGGTKSRKFIFLDGSEIFDVPNSNVTILGCTLFSHIQPAQQDNIQSMLSDFTHIEDWDVEAHNKAHFRDVKRLTSQIARIPLDRKIMVMTHYAPTLERKAHNPEHWDNPFNSAFGTDLRGKDIWANDRIVVWAFGHTHYNCDFILERNNGFIGESRPIRLVAEQKGSLWLGEEASQQLRGKVITIER